GVEVGGLRSPAALQDRPAPQPLEQAACLAGGDGQRRERGVFQHLDEDAAEGDGQDRSPVRVVDPAGQQLGAASAHGAGPPTLPATGRRPPAPPTAIRAAEESRIACSLAGMLSRTPPMSLLCRICGETTLSTTGAPNSAAALTASSAEDTSRPGTTGIPAAPS